MNRRELSRKLYSTSPVDTLTVSAYEVRVGALRPPLNSPRFECGLDIRKFPRTLWLKKRHIKSLSIMDTTYTHVSLTTAFAIRNKSSNLVLRFFTRVFFLSFKRKKKNFFAEYLIILKTDTYRFFRKQEALSISNLRFITMREFIFID